jgi:hypothetical protein
VRQSFARSAEDEEDAMHCQSGRFQPQPQRGCFPREAILAVLLGALALAALPAASLAGEKPRSYCSTGSFHSDIQTEYVTNITVGEYYGGNECKPMVIASACVQRHGHIPEQCSTASASVDGYRFVLRATGVPQPHKSVTSVPWVAYIRCETSGGNGAVQVDWPNSRDYVSFTYDTPSFRDTLRGTIEVSSAGLGVPGEKAMAGGSVTLFAHTEATVCNYDPIGTTREFEVLTDPYFEIDQTWPEAANWKIEKETAPNSGVWVEMKRDSTTVLFTDATTPELAMDAVSMGFAWGDYDGDGDLDLYVAARGTLGNRLFRNDDGVLTDVTTSVLAEPNGGNRDVSWADYDNDGDLDLFLVRESSLAPFVLMRNDGPAGFVVDATSALALLSPQARNATWADFDNDGDLDVYIARGDATGCKMFRNNGDGSFTDVTTPLLADYGSPMGAIAADYDNDGWMDIFLFLRGAHTCRLFHNTGGIFTDGTDASGIPVASLGECMAGEWVDYDDDGWEDLFVSMNGENRLFRNQGNGTFADSTEAWTGYTGWGAGVAWGDVDMDRDLDVFVTKYDKPARMVVRYDGHFGNSMFHVGGPIAGPTGARSAGWADYDGDGDLDLYVGYADHNQLLRNDQALGNHWLQVDLRGIQSNRFGVGARIRVVAGGRDSHRQVLNNSCLNGSPLRATFGLAEAAVIDTIEVRWPSGVVTTLPGPFPADQRMVIAEDGSVSGVELPVATTVLPTILGCSPNPFGPATAIRFSLPRPEAVGLTLFDVGGRLVQEILSPGAMPAGVSSLRWDGLDGQGRKARNGVYFCRIRAGSFESDRSLVFKITKVE